MEIGTTIISTSEYMELRAMKDNLEARKAEIEKNADKVLWEGGLTFWGTREEWAQNLRKNFVGKDELLTAMQSTITTLSIEVQKNDPAKIDRSLSARLHFLFTGNLRNVGE